MTAVTLTLTGSDGDALTTGNTGADAINLSTGAGAGTISTTYHGAGTRSLHFVGAATTAGLLCITKNIGVSITQIDDMTFRIKVNTLPNAEITLIRVQDSAVGQCFLLNLNGTGRLRLYNSAGTSVWLANSGANAMVAGQEYDVDLIGCTQSSSAGSLRVKATNVATTTVITDSNVGTTGAWTGTNGSLNTGANPFFSVRAGLKSGTSNATGDINIADWTLTYTPANTPPVANAGPDQAVEPSSVVTLNGTGSTDSDGTIASYLWTLVSTTGPSTPTLSSYTASSPTYTSKATWHYGHVDTWRLVVTDNLGATSSPDDVVITVKPATIGIVTNPATSAVTALKATVL
jgi:hypothetical protein